MTVPTNFLIEDLSAAGAASMTGIGAAMPPNVHLVTDNFTPGPTTDFLTMTEATFMGSAAKAAGMPPQIEGRDPTTGRRKTILKEPAGGWVWECTMAPAVAETITGYVVTDNGNMDTLGSKKFTTPITVSQLGDLVIIDEVSFLLAAIPYT